MSVPVRWFFRCHVCLGVFATEETSGARWLAPPPCPYCRGETVEIMGHVNRGKVSLTWDAAPCDGSCTAALGPVCVCRCGGENHGTRRLVRFERIAGEEEAVVQLADAAARDAAKFRRQGDEWRAAQAEADALVRARWGELIERKFRGEYLSGSDFQRYLEGREARRRIAEAAGLRVHRLRIVRLRRVVEGIKAGQQGGEHQFGG